MFNEQKSKVHKPNIKTIAIENTHLASGGSIVPYNHIKKIYQLTQQLNVNLHIDGARVWKHFPYPIFCISQAIPAGVAAPDRGHAA